MCSAEDASIILIAKFQVTDLFHSRVERVRANFVSDIIIQYPLVLWLQCAPVGPSLASRERTKLLPVGLGVTNHYSVTKQTSTQTSKEMFTFPLKQELIQEGIY